MPAAITVTPELLAEAAGIVLSLAFSYFPGLRDKWAAQTSEGKSLGMLLILAAASLTIWGISCKSFGIEWAGLILNIPCDQSGAERLFAIFLHTAITNQTVYRLSPQLKSAATQAPTPVETKASPFVQELPPVTLKTTVPIERNPQSHM